ncbi:hypothetical protein HHI36_011723 [Cryptolaemus montrouzieri]|uniref:Uncharacterized protein n=1 Tax=Cryptolaemus montrouzieri TaxID=559131 RepID=A0ABD2NDU0_9CUCU
MFFGICTKVSSSWLCSCNWFIKNNDVFNFANLIHFIRFSQYFCVYIKKSPEMIFYSNRAHLPEMSLYNAGIGKPNGDPIYIVDFIAQKRNPITAPDYRAQSDLAAILLLLPSGAQAPRPDVKNESLPRTIRGIPTEKKAVDVLLPFSENYILTIGEV